MKKFYLISAALLVSGIVLAYEMNTLIDSPTAGILQKGEAEISGKLYKNNGLIIGAKVGLFPRFMFGVNYGAEEVVGNKTPKWHDRVEFNAKLRIIDETSQMPAIAFGYDSQGHGNYHEGEKRYDIKSKGIFATASKNYFFLGNLGFHFGANYSLETEDGDEGINLFSGLDKTIGDMIVVVVEYDAAWNDNVSTTVNGRGYLNASFDVHFSEDLILKLSFYDLFQNRDDTQGSDRTLTLLYNMTF